MANHWEEALYKDKKGNLENIYLRGSKRIKHLAEMIKFVDSTFTFKNFNENSKILEIGCNIGMNLRFMQGLFGCTVTGLDINDEAIKNCKAFFGEKDNFKKIDFRLNSGLDKYDDNEFDLGFSTAVLTHIPADDSKSKLIAEFLRVCKQVVICEAYNPTYKITEQNKNEFCIVYEDYTKYSNKLKMYSHSIMEDYKIYYKYR